LGGGVWRERTSLHYGHENVAFIKTLHGLRSAALITGACQVSRLHLVRSPASILRNEPCQITAIEIREPPGRVQTQQFQSTTAGPDHTAIGDVHASSSTQCLLLIRAGRSCLPCHCAVSILSERIVLFTSSTCTPIATVYSSAAAYRSAAFNPSSASSTSSSCIPALAASFGRCLRAVVNRRGLEVI
jgi:hypothetical protein